MTEIVVAMAIFGVLVTAALGVLVRTAGLAGQNVRRTAAANLLTRQLEAAQGVRAADLTPGTTTTTATVGNITYDIRQDVSYVSSADGTSLCDQSAGDLLYKLVTVKVTWPDMQLVQPVRGDVLRALGVGSEGSDAARGALAVSVKDPDGVPIVGATASLYPTGATGTSDAQGCVVFVDLAPGWFYASANANDGRPQGWSSWASVLAGGIQRTTVIIYPPPPPPPPPPTPSPTPTTEEPTPSPTDTGGSTPTTEPTTETPTPTDTGGSSGTETATPDPTTETTTTPPVTTTTTTAPTPSPSPSPTHDFEIS